MKHHPVPAAPLHGIALGAAAARGASPMRARSNGALAALSAVQEGAPGREATGPPYRSAGAFYPGCRLTAGSDFRARGVPRGTKREAGERFDVEFAS